MKARVSNIQRFSLHDGPGIRTTIFFMGCPLKCPWCCNPENMTYDIKKYIDSYGNYKIYGSEYSDKELEKEILKDREYYIDGGGVTYSGGESLLYLKNHINLLNNLKKNKIHQCVETSLSIPSENLKKVIEYIDLFYVDLKIINKFKFKKMLNGDIELVKSNLELLKKYKSKFIFRIPLVSEYTLNKENILEMKKLINKYKPLKIEVFSVHNLAKQKYKSLKMDYQEFQKIETSVVNQIKEYLNS